MKQEEIRLLFQQFEQVACVSGEVECWSAREQIVATASLQFYMN